LRRNRTKIKAEMMMRPLLINNSKEKRLDRQRKKIRKKTDKERG